MKRGKYQRLRNPQPSARVAMLAFLRANFHTSSPELRQRCFNTADREEFEVILDQLFACLPYDMDARGKLDQMVANVHQHILNTQRLSEPNPPA